MAVVIHLGFALAAMFSPDAFGMLFPIGDVEFSYVWLGNMGMLLLAVNLCTIPVARDPERYAAYAWLLVVEKLAASVLWLCLVLTPRYGASYVPLLVIDGALALIPLVLLQLGLPPASRLGSEGFARVMAAFREAPKLEGALAWYRRVVYVGVVINLAFVIPSIFAPALMRAQVGAQYVDFSWAWLAGAGVVLFGVTLLYLPGALNPVARNTMAWLIVPSRLIAAVFWLSIARQPGHGVFWSFFVNDLLFGVVTLILLQRGLPEDQKLSGARLGAFVSELVAFVTMKGRSQLYRIVAVVIAVAFGAVGYSAWYYLARTVPDAQFASDEEHFKYGAIGVTMSQRIPLRLWQVIPTVCGDKLPDRTKGWASLGFVYEPGKDVPVGFAKREIGYPSVEANCALCHTGSYRTTAQAAPVVIPAGPAHELDLQGFQWFLYDCASDPRFTADTLISEMEKLSPFGVVEKLYYRFAIIPAAKKGLLMQESEYAWQKRRPKQGKGRTDTFNPTKFDVFYMPDDRSIGTTDLPQVWNQKPREHLWLHWDGNNNKIHERNYAAAMAIGATPDSVIDSSFQRVTNYLLTLAAPRYPLPIDETASARGKAIYEQQCASCHSFQGGKIGQVTPLAEIGTDRHRLDSFTAELVADFHKIDMPPFKFDAYRKTDGYSNTPLDGVWARGPYLHHGAVPTLWDLLSPPAARPKVFSRGYNVIDATNVGFVSQGPEAEAIGFRVDTAVDGNGNGGHTYGTQLAEPDKKDLLEFMKTL